MNPSLALIPSAYSAGKLYSALPEDGTGDFTVSRNGTATYLGSDGLIKTAQANEPRLEFNTDGSFKGVLVEPAATNLLLRSENFGDDAYWAKENISIIQTNAVSPSGQLNASLIQESNLFAFQRIFSPSINYTTQNSLSLFVKYVNARYIRLSLGGITPDSILENRRADFDIVNGTVLRDTTYSSTAKINSIGNGWFRISFANQAPSVSSLNRFIINFLDSSGSDNIVIQGESRQLLIWGAQLEVGSVATSYIPTEGTTVTRPADVIQRTNAQDLIGQTEGSIYVEINISKITPGIGRRIIGVSDNSTSSRLGITLNSPLNTTIIKNSQVSLLPVNLELGKNKLLVSYNDNEISYCVNGSIPIKVSTDGSGLYNQINFGSTESLSFQYNDNIKNFALFKIPLTDEQAIALTTL